MLPAGARLGVYEILAILGHGSFGITYRARNTSNDQDVAIKEYFPASLALRDGASTVLPRSTDLAEEFTWGRARFVEEERTLVKLNGVPAIVQVLDFIEANGTAYMVMALVQGETLDRKLQRDGRLAQAEIDRLLGPLLIGLERVHAEGFLHRDIKPGNIIVDVDGNPTLIDFGAARAAMIGRTQTLTAVFTPGYAPVEQFTSAKQGPYTDIYALGATLYQCVTGKVPPNAIDRVVGTAMTPAAVAGIGYDPKLLAGIDAALVPDAMDRPQTIAKWREVFASGIGPDAAATRVLRGRASARPQRRGLWIVAGVAGLLIASGGGYLALRPVTLPVTLPVTPPGPTQAEVEAKQKAEADAAAQQVAAEKARAELEARVKDAEAARVKAEQERTQLQEAEQARLEAQRKAEEAARQKADAEAKQKAEEEARQKAQASDKKLAEAGETALRLSLLDRQHLQVALTAQGFNTGGTDGTFGPRSRDTIAAWQKARNQPATGFFTAVQEQSLMKDAATAISKFDEEQKKTEDDKKKAAGQPAAKPGEQTSAPPAAASGAHDGLWFGALDCKSQRVSLQGMIAAGHGTLSGTGGTAIALQISGDSVSASMQGPGSGQVQGKLNGRSAYLQGIFMMASGSGQQCAISLVAP